ncbi:class I SAM-dependent methyltransferase [Tropicibacter oceani]|uniref:Class I SAM-dependent methyltransferase n=1 Tax=Tropicibacter oceani TaxID=3058420 RepID=A0ABY8QGV0_9RHOB|nr:class I SAM-dependent methyltransferase [Tropicibacter oceani]WGW03228.1 class I SAM-dependent methyltransferase [Tropicibacter oceani]
MSAEFFTLHSDLPREGPGRPEDVAWALGLGGVQPGARILDAGCGPGADIAALLLAAAPGGHVTAVDAHAPFVAQAAKRWGRDSRVTLMTGDMQDAEGPFDVIWCAGALYFLGLREGLDVMRGKLRPGGILCFSELVFRGGEPDAALRTALEAEYPAIRPVTHLDGMIRAAGLEPVGQKILPRASLEAYYQPMEKRIAQLRPGADAALNRVLDEGAAEIALWRRHWEDFGYALCVTRRPE